MQREIKEVLMQLHFSIMLIILCSLMFYNCASAHQITHQDGKISCADFTQNQQASSDEYNDKIVQWVIGYVSGRNMEQHTNDAARDLGCITPDTVFRDIIRFCSENAEQDIGNAADEIYKNLPSDSCEINTVGS